MTKAKRHIAIEAQRIFRTNKHGMDFVALETIRELQKRDDGNHYYVFVAPGEDRCLKESANLTIIELPTSNYLLWEQIALPRALKKYPIELLHCTSNTAPLCCPVPLVLTLHDIIYLEPRQHRSPSLYQELGWYYRKFVVPRILKKCKQIITVSKFECERIRTALNIPEDKITAIYNGFNTHFCQQSEIDINIVKEYIPQAGYLFFLGNTDAKKNAARTLKAYVLYLQQSTVKRPLLIAYFVWEHIDKLLEQEGISDIRLIINRFDAEKFIEYEYYPDLDAVIDDAGIRLIAVIPEDFNLLKAAAKGVPCAAGLPATTAFDRLSARLCGENIPLIV